MLVPIMTAGGLALCQADISQTLSGGDSDG